MYPFKWAQYFSCCLDGCKGTESVTPPPVWPTLTQNEDNSLAHRHMCLKWESGTVRKWEWKWNDASFGPYLQKKKVFVGTKLLWYSKQIYILRYFLSIYSFHVFLFHPSYFVIWIFIPVTTKTFNLCPKGALLLQPGPFNVFIWKFLILHIVIVIVSSTPPPHPHTFFSFFQSHVHMPVCVYKPLHTSSTVSRSNY